MAEIPNRDELEANFARNFGKLARRHMHEYRELLGDPADPDNVPQKFWDKMQREVDNETYAILLLMFLESSEYHGWGGYDAKLAGYGWATQRAENLSKYWVDSTRARLADGFEKLTRPEPIKETTVDEARAANRFAGVVAGGDTNHGQNGQSSDESELGESGWLNPYEPREPTKKEIRELLDHTFGPKRVEGVAITETTRAQYEGGEAAIEATVGISSEDEWRVQESSPGVPDEKVCPLCRSVNRVKRKDWPWRLNEGPPCHPNDRCFIEYALFTPMEAVGRMLDDPDYKSMIAVRKSYDPSEARDDGGKWTAGGSVGGKESAALLDKIAAGDKRSKNGGELRKVNDEKPHTHVDFPLSNLSSDTIEHLRDSTDKDRVDRYTNEKIDTPIHVMQNRKGKWVVCDGGHRTMAAIQRGDATIPALVPSDSVQHIDSSSSEHDHIKSASEDWIKNGVKSKAFNGWFGDSKATDSNGKPLKVFHGTTFDYGDFDTGNKKNGAVLGYGAYFTDDPDRAAAYAGGHEGANTKPTYLAVKNPFVVNGTLTQDEADRIGKILSESSDGKNLLASPRVSREFTKADQDEAESLYGEKMQEWKESGDGMARTKPKVDSANGKFVITFSDSSKQSVPLNAAEAFANIMSLHGPDSSTILQKAGFDGVNRGDEWVVFDPKQIKSATGNRGPFDPHSSNITKSLIRQRR